MIDRRRGTARRLGRLAAAGLVASLVAAQALLAQGTTGKLEGTVHDPAGAPIVGAQVRIAGTAFAAVSNERGYYFINNVPAGVYLVAAQYIGFAPAEVRNVRVWADQTMTVDVPMEPRAIQISGVTVTVEETPIVPRDQVASKSIQEGSVIQALPVDNVSQVLRLQPGVVEGRSGQTIRGGRPGDAATYIDGVLVRNLVGMSSSVTVGTNALEEASVTTGALAAEYGDAQEGVVNLVTRAGGRSFRGNVSFATDDPAGEVYGTGLNRLEASLSGPLAVRGLTFFLATTLQGRQNARRPQGAEHVPYYVLAGVDTTVTVPLDPGSPTSDSAAVDLPRFAPYSHGSRLPMSWASDYTVDGKLQYSFGSGSRLSFTYHYTGGSGLSPFSDGSSILTGTSYNPMLNVARWSGSSAYILNWTQNLAQSAERALFLDATLSYQRDRTIDGGIVDPQWAMSHQQPFLWFTLAKPPFQYDLDSWPVDDRLVQNIRLGNCLGGRDAARPELGACVPFNGRYDLVTSSPYRASPYGLYAATTGLMNPTGSPGLNLSSESRLTGRVRFDWQADRNNRMRFGGDFVTTDMVAFWSSQNTTSGQDVYKENPLRYGLFASDRLDLGDVVIDFGLRYDRMDSRVLYPRLPNATYWDPLRTGDLATAFSAADTAMAARCGALYAAVQGAGATPADTTAWSTCNYSRARPHAALSPRIGVSFPVTDRTGFRLSYAHQLQTPSFFELAYCHNTACGLAGRDLTYGKTILFEFGVRHAFSPDMVLDVAVYNRDVVANVAARRASIYEPREGKPTDTSVFTNADYGYVRGVDVKLDRRIGELFRGTLTYTYQSNLTTGSDPYDYLNRGAFVFSTATGENLPPPEALMVSSENRYHTIAGNLSLNFPHGWHGGDVAGAILEDVGLNATFRFASGLPYTPLFNTGAGTRGPGNGFSSTYLGTEVLNSATMPWIKNVDLRVTRAFRLGGRDLTVFADFRNLFDWTNLTYIFAETGSAVNGMFKAKFVTTYLTALQNEAGALWQLQDSTGNGVTTPRFAMDLRDCTQYAPSLSYGLPNCLMLRRTEERFGNGDHVLDDVELAAAMDAFFVTYRGPWFYKDAGLNIRFGFELNF